MNTEYYVIIGGVHSLLFAIFHLLFWKLFDWKRDLNRVSKVNKAIFQIINIRLIFIFLFTGINCIMYPNELINSLIGRIFLFGGFLFWTGRAIEQIVFFKFESFRVNIFTFIFLIGAVLFLIPII